VTVEQVRRRVECDIFYIDNWSILLDLKILALTPIKVVFDNGNAF
jgi:lipopolysaccharide/colanic/teichoic acid biosynthesis glycosyltransferase